MKNRTTHKTSCPYCSRNNRSEAVSKAKFSKKNSLKTWCLNNSSFGEQLMYEWTGKCEDGKHYKTDEVTRAGGKKFKWGLQ